MVFTSAPLALALVLSGIVLVAILGNPLRLAELACLLCFQPRLALRLGCLSYHRRKRRLAGALYKSLRLVLLPWAWESALTHCWWEGSELWQGFSSDGLSASEMFLSHAEMRKASVFGSFAVVQWLTFVCAHFWTLCCFC